MPTSHQYSRHNPRPVRRCFICGVNTMLPRSADKSMLTILSNGRSLVICRKHWRLLRRFACPATIEHYRQKFLIDAHRLHNVVAGIQFQEQRHERNNHHGKL